MKKKFLILPVLAALFAACTSDELVVVDNQTQQTEEDGAIAFDAYLTRSVTRAGAPGILTTSNSTAPNVSLQAKGFGVFAYYADGDLYSENAIPDFMYNQQVIYSGGWTYSPIKYWPNEFGASAISTGVDRVTFFAYAPYVAVEPSTGQLTSTYNGSTTELSTETGITALTRNGKTGDPYVRYVAAFDPTKCVDLCYGVAADDFKSAVGAADGANDIKAGDPYINVAKPAIGSKINFDFKHALAQLTVKVDADVDILSHDEGDVLDEKTRIWVRSITFDGVAQRGYLNLNSGMWYDVIDNTKISHASVTVHDGRRDGAEALATDTYETPIGFNTDLVQSAAYTTTLAGGTTFPYTSLTTTTDGVTGVNKNLFNGTGTLLVIPANEQMKVTIVYDVETADATLPKYLSDGTTKGSTVENKITKSIVMNGSPLKLDAGKAYTINLHLGMTTVNFDATVSDWVEDGTGNVDLPINAPSASAVAASPAATETLNISASPSTGVFAVSGLAAGASTTTSSETWLTFTPASGAVVADDGVLNVNYTVAENGVNDRSATLTVSDGSKSAVLTINQQHAALGLSITTAAKAGESAITLGTTATMAASDWTGATYTVDKKHDGTTTTLTSPTNYSVSDAGVITLVDAAVAGDIYTITVEAGDADPETVSFTVEKQAGSISYATPETPVEVKVTPAATATVHKALTNTGDGVVTYSISKDSGAGTPSVDNSLGNEGKVTITGAAVDDVYTVTATVVDSDTYTYATKTATYKIKIIAD